MSRPLHQIVISPILTEKSVRNTLVSRYTRKEARVKAAGNAAVVETLLEQKIRKYTFKVALNATKDEIANAIEQIFAKEKIRVASVNTVHMRGKERRNIGKRSRSGMLKGKSPDWKKAIVTLTTDSPSIPMLEGV